jgi:hypothetical protein
MLFQSLRETMRIGARDFESWATLLEKGNPGSV